jgi:hypothetical protein
MLALRPGECKLGSSLPALAVETSSVADALLYLVWIGAAALLYAIVIGALRARRRRVSDPPPADLSTIADDRGEAL